jgi:hypothetical protein
MENIPSKDRPEWKNLLNPNSNIELNNFVLQMKITQAKKDIKKGKKTIDSAIDEIYNLCQKYALAVKQDMETIFNN